MRYALSAIDVRAAKSGIAGSAVRHAPSAIGVGAPKSGIAGPPGPLCAVRQALQAGYLNDPRVNAEVLNFRPYYILGEVQEPGEYPYNSGLTVMNAVATAGGFTYRANTRVVYIKRAGSTRELEFTLTPETTVNPGDTVRVAERFF